MALAVAYNRGYVDGLKDASDIVMKEMEDRG